ncbi:hypothetical protein [Geodermatophilus marinus]|uniref:hypothetical protein n=1 Tax=Geodermatophilus sp. LHW52908 TaxID=2303986 RepID=UPI000E3DE630|nr:hypothetical protein [Geodermatophilus sp. LHW52908]RFU20673.1 hypothetical protein D0Z06_15340 [Geodermatophilus sp. LHW52908]
MAGRRRRTPDEPLPVRALREGERHAVQVAGYGFFPGRGPRRSATVVPAPLVYWQHDPPRAWVVLSAAAFVAAWLGLFAWTAGPSATVGELPLALLVGAAVVALSTSRLTVSDAGFSVDVAGLRRTTALHVVPRSLVREVRRGAPPEGWPRARRRGGRWPGRARVAVRHLTADGSGEQATLLWLRDPETFAAALGQPLR